MFEVNLGGPAEEGVRACNPGNGAIHFGEVVVGIREAAIERVAGY